MKEQVTDISKVLQDREYASLKSNWRTHVHFVPTSEQTPFLNFIRL